MFGQMMVKPVVQLDPGVDLQTAAATLIRVAENVEVVRWIELPASVLLFLLVLAIPNPGRSTFSIARPESGTSLTSRTNNSAATPRPILMFS